MNYTYKYRDKSGAIVNGTVEAKSRSEAFEKLRDCSVISMNESRINNKNQKVFLRSNSFKYVIAISMGLTIVCITLFLLNSQDPQNAVKDISKTPKKLPEKIVSQVLQNDKSKDIEVKKVASSPQPATNTDVNTTNHKVKTNSNLLKRDPNARVIPHRQGPQKRFLHDAEEDIASLLEIEPGEMLVGELKYGKRFLEDFKSSLTNKITILESDTQEQRSLKEAVIATKEDLKKRMENGEDICQIMRDTRKQLQEIGIYKMDLMAKLYDIRKSGEWTAEEYVKFVESANKLMEEKGGSPIKLPRVILRQLKKEQKVEQSQSKENLK